MTTTNLSRSTAPFIGAVKDEWSLFSDSAQDYVLGPPIGFGSSSTVYRATYHPKSSHQQLPIPCALKVLDLDRLPQASLRLLQWETQLMSLSKHPNVLRVRGSWIDGHKLHIALRLMNAGSAADVMHFAWPGGMEEDVIRCILKQALNGLNYLHINGFIHRDIKAANLLIDDDGTVLLGDLGVAAPLQDEDHTHVNENATPSRDVIFDPNVEHAPRRSRIGKRRSFVGTPCWMAPEIISGMQYDSSADIWSFGITALELAQGRAPRSRESSRNVLLHIVQAAPPTLDREGGVHKYSRAFKEIVERCLVKDPSLRPSAAQLLQTPFFKNAKKPSYLVGTILSDLPPLARRLERRKQPTLVLHGTIDSWDFPTALLTPSPTQSVHRRLQQAGLHSRESIDEQGEQDEQMNNDARPEVESPHASRNATSPPSPMCSPSNVLPGASTGCPAAKRPLTTAALSPICTAAPPTVVPASPLSPGERPFPGPSPSLWSRIRRSTSTAKTRNGREPLLSASTCSDATP